jgi:hypothetical protein
VDAEAQRRRSRSRGVDRDVERLALGGMEGRRILPDHADRAYLSAFVFKEATGWSHSTTGLARAAKRGR